MKPNRIRNGLVATVAAGVLLAGCGTMMGGQNIPLSNSPRVPAAVGTVKTKITKEGNTEFQVKVEHLAPADRVARGANTYVVWVLPMEGNERPQNVGALQVDRNDSGTFNGITPFRRFQLTITAEPNITTQNPSRNQVLTAQVFQYESRK